jgi:hypothetical protein
VVGRPSKYSQTYCGEVISFLAEGHSLTAFAGEIGVAPSTVKKWAKEIDEFSDAVKRGQAKAVAFWERAVIKLATTGEGNATACIFGLKNRAAEEWADISRTELTGKDGEPVRLEQVTNDADAFTRAIAGLAARKGTGRGTGETEH